VAVERRHLSHAADAAALGRRGTIAAPLLDAQAPERVTGMLVLGGDAPADSVGDKERRVALTCSELSRLLGRINLLDHWQAAAANPTVAEPKDRQSNGGATHDRTDGRGASSTAPASSAEMDKPRGGPARDDREVPLQ